MVESLRGCLDRFDCLGQTAKPMAHCVYSGKRRAAANEKNGIYRPLSGINMNLSSGVAPVSDIPGGRNACGIGSDVAGSTRKSVQAMALAIQASSCAGGCRMTV